MKPRFFIFLLLALASLTAAAVLTARQYASYQSASQRLAEGSTIAGIPVGGLVLSEAGLRVVMAYEHTPVALHHSTGSGQVIANINPTDAGLQLDIAGMVEQARTGQESQRPSFWGYLLNQRPGAVEVPLRCSVDATRLRAYLEAEIAPRYAQLPTAAAPIAGTVNFQPGQPGEQVDLERTAEALGAALCSLENRSAALRVTAVDALPPAHSQLALALEALVQVNGFDGLVELYYQDLQSGEEIQLAVNGGKRIDPGVAFTAASTIKIPVMVSAYRQVEGALPDTLRREMAEMIDLSDNASTDAVMQSVLDEFLAPIQVTQDARALELKDTFLAGFFYPGAPLLDRYTTPANQRVDVSTDPDVYNQTTATDMGRLLAAIYTCAEDESGPLVDTFNGAVTQAECVEMVDLLALNRKGLLIEAGLPEGTRMAHKYGWVSDALDGLMHTASDAAIVFTPGGDYILTVYLYHQEQLQWMPAQWLVAQLAAAGYNFHNQWR